MRTWIKLYTEILHDPKMHGLTDKQFRACINLFALAGYIDKDGLIGTFEDIRFHLRTSRRDTESILKRLENVAVLTFDDQNYTVTAFSKRNGIAPSQSNEKVLQRVQAFRARKQAESENGNEDVTSLHPECNEDVTTLEKRREEKNRIDKSREEKSRSTAAKPPVPPAVIAYREAAHKYPNKSLYEMIDQHVGSDLDRVSFWRSVVTAYIGLGWNPANITGQLEWFDRNELPHKNGYSNGNGQNSEPSNPMLRAIARREGKLT